MFEKLKKKRAEEQREGRWMVFNFGSDLEFAECTLCGAEQEPSPPFPWYPKKCPKCGARMTEVEWGKHDE